jgi:hypothetical protein
MADTNAGSTAKEIEITPELVRELADKVYKLWLAEAKIASERGRRLPPASAAYKGISRG